MSDTAERVKKIVVEHLNVDADKVPTPRLSSKTKSDSLIPSSW
jgi:acyl carrier protein